MSFPEHRLRASESQRAFKKSWKQNKGAALDDRDNEDEAAASKEIRTSEHQRAPQYQYNETIKQRLAEQAQSDEKLQKRVLELDNYFLEIQNQSTLWGNESLAPHHAEFPWALIAERLITALEKQRAEKIELIKLQGDSLNVVDIVRSKYAELDRSLALVNEHDVNTQNCVAQVDKAASQLQESFRKLTNARKLAEKSKAQLELNIEHANNACAKLSALLAKIHEKHGNQSVIAGFQPSQATLQLIKQHLDANQARDIVNTICGMWRNLAVPLILKDGLDTKIRDEIETLLVGVDEPLLTSEIIDLDTEMTDRPLGRLDRRDEPEFTVASTSATSIESPILRSNPDGFASGSRNQIRKRAHETGIQAIAEPPPEARKKPTRGKKVGGAVTTMEGEADTDPVVQGSVGIAEPKKGIVAKLSTPPPTEDKFGGTLDFEDFEWDV